MLKDPRVPSVPRLRLHGGHRCPAYRPAGRPRESLSGGNKSSRDEDSAGGPVPCCRRLSGGRSREPPALCPATVDLAAVVDTVAVRHPGRLARGPRPARARRPPPDARVARCALGRDRLVRRRRVAGAGATEPGRRTSARSSTTSSSRTRGPVVSNAKPKSRPSPNAIAGSTLRSAARPPAPRSAAHAVPTADESGCAASSTSPPATKRRQEAEQEDAPARPAASPTSSSRRAAARAPSTRPARRREPTEAQ